MGRGQTSDLRQPGRNIVVITTASLPWRTGTAVNPLLRTAYLAHALKDAKVTLLVPWLAKCEQKIVYPEGVTFETSAQQAKWVKEWVEKRTEFPAAFDIKFYPGRYDESFLSIFPVGDPTAFIPDYEADVAILEEPEHLTWFHHGRRYTEKFRHVLGILHTNYIDYIRRGGAGNSGGPLAARIVGMANRRMCDIHCHKVIKLSDAVQHLPREQTLFVHGVPPCFLSIGDRMAAAAMQTSKPITEVASEADPMASNGGAHSEEKPCSPAAEPEEGAELEKMSVSAQRSSSPAACPDEAPKQPSLGSESNGRDYSLRAQPGRSKLTDSDGNAAGEGSKQRAAGTSREKKEEMDKDSFQFSKGAYFIGKCVWGKGYTELLELLRQHREHKGYNLPVDVYGTGEDLEAIKARAEDYQLELSFKGARDHLDDSIHPYRVFINPSTSDVVATTSAEALAMGKWLLCAEHPSNTFFRDFQNALIYTSSADFSEKLKFAEVNSPSPLSAEDRRRLTWEDATERLLDAAVIYQNEWPGTLSRLKEWLTWRLIYAGNGIEPVRWIVGAGKHTRFTPRDVDAYDPQAPFRYRDYVQDHVSIHLAQGYPPPRIL